MIRRITRVAPWQAAKFFAVLYFIMGLIFAAFMAVIVSMAPGAPPQGMSLAFVIAMPFVYAIGALILVPIACWIFNFVAGLVGGLEIEVTHQEG